MIRWELITAYALPTIFLGLAWSSTGWVALGYIIWFIFSTWLSIPLAAIAYWRWENKKEVFYFIPGLLLGLFNALLFIIN